MQFFKDRIKAKDLDGKKGEVLEGWLKRISEEDPDAEVGPDTWDLDKPGEKEKGWGDMLVPRRVE